MNSYREELLKQIQKDFPVEYKAIQVYIQLQDYKYEEGVINSLKEVYATLVSKANIGNELRKIWEE